MEAKRKKVVCVFAHPDDEAFGPSGTIAKFALECDVYIICITKGQAGKNSHMNQAAKLDKLRVEELYQSAQVLGVKKVFFLGFRDGHLNNNLYHKVADKIKKRLEILKPEILLTFEPRGISGHIDHIFATLVTTYIFYKLNFVKELFYYCVTQDRKDYMKKNFPEYFIYNPPGYVNNEIHKIIDISSVWDKKITAINTHESQKHDAQRILKVIHVFPKEEHFIILKK